MAALPVLTFHSIDDPSSVIAFPRRLFERGMAMLYDHGFRALTLLDVVDHLRRGVAFPERSFAMTFDDGYQSIYQRAFPILQRYGFPATVFLTVGENSNRTASERLPSMYERSMLSWREIREMHKCGITVGAHTLTHPDLTRLPLEKVEIEIRDSKAAIENALGAPATCFSYPFGRYNVRCRELVRHYFRCACSDRLGLIHANADAYALERVDAYYLRTESLFAAMSTRLFPLYVRARAVPRRVRRAFESCVSGRFRDKPTD